MKKYVFIQGYYDFGANWHEVNTNSIHAEDDADAIDIFEVDTISSPYDSFILNEQGQTIQKWEGNKLETVSICDAKLMSERDIKKMIELGTSREEYEEFNIHTLTHFELLQYLNCDRGIR